MPSTIQNILPVFSHLDDREEIKGSRMTLNKNKIEIKMAMAEFESIGEIPKD